MTLGDDMALGEEIHSLADLHDDELMLSGNKGLEYASGFHGLPAVRTSLPCQHPVKQA